MNTFQFDDGSPAEFMERVRGVLGERGLADHVTLRLVDGELVVVFHWLGTSELRYRISETQNGFRAELRGERISPFHSPFRHQFEDRFEQVVGAVGAKIVSF